MAAKAKKTSYRVKTAPATKTIPRCIDPHSEAYGNHPWEAWGSDGRFELCRRCDPQRLAPGVTLSERAMVPPTKLTPRQKKLAIAKASQPLFSDVA
jgi:hypothetical protein